MTQQLAQIPDEHRLGTGVLSAHMFSCYYRHMMAPLPIPTVIFSMYQLNTHLDWVAPDCVTFKVINVTFIRIH